MAEELVDILDENGNKTGVTKTKREAQAKGLWHMASHIWAYNSKGEILFQKRSHEKDTWPGMLDVSVAGHVSAGESPLQAAVREATEELGIKVNAKDLKPASVEKTSKTAKPGYYENEFEYLYLLKLDELPKNLQKEEVDIVLFVPLETLERELNDPETAKKYILHPYYPKLIKMLKKEVSKSG